MYMYMYMNIHIYYETGVKDAKSCIKKTLG